MIIRSVAGDDGTSPQPRRRSSGTLRIAIIAAAIIAIAAFSEVLSFYYPDEASAGPYLVTVYIPNGAADNRSLTFSPANFTIVLGINNTIEWFNLDKTPDALHTVVFTQIPAGSNFTAASISSYPASSGIRYDIYYGPILLSAPGVYQYYDYYHPWMTGTIVVES